MAIRYECAHCQAVFPAEELVEGRERGYLLGFACPRCGGNVRDNLLTATQRMDACQKKWLNRIGWLFLPFVVSSFFDLRLSVAGHGFGLDTLLLIVFVVAVALVLAFVPCTRRSGVFVTERVEPE